MLEDTFRKYNLEKFPSLREIGYLRIDYLQRKYSEKLKIKKNSILIAPTLFEGFPEFTILEYLDEIISELLNIGDIKIKMFIHSLAFGALKTMIGNENNNLSKKNIEMTQDVMCNNLIYWSQDLFVNNLFKQIYQAQHIRMPF